MLCIHLRVVAAMLHIMVKLKTSAKHMGLSPLTGKQAKATYQSTAFKDHLLFCVHSI